MPTDPTGYISHEYQLHRGMTWKTAVHVATTANITISTGLNAGDTIDGQTLIAGWRVLVKDQGTASQNGIWIVGATPSRAADMDQDSTTAVPANMPGEAVGVVFVLLGTANAGTFWYTTSSPTAVIGTNDIDFTQLTVAAPSVALDDLTDVTISGAATDETLRYNGSVWFNDPRRWEPVMDSGNIVTESGDIVMDWKEY